LSEQVDKYTETGKESPYSPWSPSEHSDTALEEQQLQICSATQTVTIENFPRIPLVVSFPQFIELPYKVLQFGTVFCTLICPSRIFVL
jgi:hypothetical protein